MPANLPVAFAALLAGGLLIEKGAKATAAAFSGSSPASSSPLPSGSSSGGGKQIPASSFSTLPSGGQAHGLVTTAALTAIGAAHGWSGQQITDWMSVVQAESNGTLTDTNRSSGAYGIAQFINGPTDYYAHGGDPNTLVGQLAAMANYIAERYGNPSKAWAHEQESHWY